MSTKKLETHAEMMARWQEEGRIIGIFTELAQRRGIIRSCINCDHFKEKEGEICARFPGYEMRPPARVIALGCVSWVEVIPF